MAQAQDNKLGIASLVLGIIGVIMPFLGYLASKLRFFSGENLYHNIVIDFFIVVVLCILGLGCGIAGIILSKRQKNIRRSGLSTAGLVLGIIAIIINGILLAIALLALSQIGSLRFGLIDPLI
ncbi:MAG: hypothetical protein V1702_00520 [Candidatus Woesearchaeota archaeon]